MDIYEKLYNEELQRGQRMSGGGAVAPIVCPTMKNEPCKVCELCYGVFKKIKDKNDPMRIKATNYNQKKKYYSNIIFPALNPVDIRLFEYGETIFRQLFNANVDELSEYKKFFDPDQGRNLYIIKYPAPIKKNTKYGIEFRIQATPIPLETRPLIPGRLFQLDKVLDYVAQGVPILRQGDLADGRNEVRILPSWINPTSQMFFMVMKYHFIPRTEFDAIQAGQFNPFKDEIIVPKPVGNPVPAPTSWEVKAPTTPPPTPIMRPPCYGSYEEGNPLCMSRCEPSTVRDCKPESLRRTASNLYPRGN